MTELQKHLLDFITAELTRTGIAPSFDEMRVALGLRAKSGVHRLLTVLQNHGHIRRVPRRERGIELVARDLTSATDTALLAECARRKLLEVRHG